MKVLSLYDGMSCGMLAFNSAGIPVERYVAYEIDRYAIQVSEHNFPIIEHKGDVFKGDFTEYEGFDAVIGASPCTFWSISQKKDVRETEPHGMGWDLFQQYVRAVREAKPRFFIYENNHSMSKAVYDGISKTFGFESIMIDSALVSAQRREREYWVGIRNPDGTYRKADISQPEDRRIMLKDVVDGMTDREKSRTVAASVGRTTTRGHFYKCQNTMVAEPVSIACRTRDREDGRFKRFEARDSKSNCMTTVRTDYMVAEPIRVGSLPRPNGELSTSQAMRVYSMDGKSVGLRANGGGMGGKTGLYAMQQSEDSSERHREIGMNHLYDVKDGMIEVKGRRYPIKLHDGQYIIRKLTVDECKRLQTVPDSYDMTCISDTQAYKCLGNGWTVEVIAHLIKGAMGDKKTKCIVQKTLF